MYKFTFGGLWKEPSDSHKGTKKEKDTHKCATCWCLLVHPGYLT